MTQLTRKDVLDTLTEALEPLDYVLAFWEGGAAGFGRADEWSDIDAQAIVDDDRVEEVFKAVDAAVEKLGGTVAKFRLPEPTWHGHSQCFYKLKDASPFLLIDLAIMKEHTEADKFDVWATHGKPIVRFDKNGLIREAKLDPEAHAKAIMKRLDMLKNLFEIFHIMPMKETNRGNHIEAMFFYLGQTYRPLVEALRMKHCPQRYNYATRYVYYDLPPEVVKRLEGLTFFKPEEMEAKVGEVREWFREAANSISVDDIRAKLTGNDY
ncbi:MAG: nucleotidyltransferase domain-containing protein [Thermoplasmata archaeon]